MFKSRYVSAGASVIAAVALGGSHAGAQCPKDWIGGEPFRGVNGPVGASVVWDPDGAGPLQPILVVAGDFSMAGQVAAARIAAWDGTAWSSRFGAGLDGPVRALAVYNGELIAAGEFSQAGGAGGVAASRIARWNGTAWLPLGAGIDGPVYALAVNNGLLCVGGDFGHAGGVTVSALASWDGTAWSAIGLSGVDGNVSALASFNNALYVGGQFTHADSITATGIARWDGAAWSAVGTGVGGADVRTFLVDGGSLYVGGGFVEAGGVAAYGVARWSGTAWAAVGQGLYHQTCVRYSCGPRYVYPVRTLTKLGTYFYAVTDSGTGAAPLVFRSAGSTWSSMGALPARAVDPWGVTTATAYNGSVYVGGNFGGAGSPMNITRLNGTQWGLVTGMDGPIESLTPYNNGLVAVGGFTQIDGVAQNHVAFWDGSQWHALGSGISASATTGATLGNNLYVSAWPGGVLQWDGAAWTTLYGAGGFGGPPVVTTWNNQVIAAIGYAGFGGDQSAIATWNGAAWTPMGEVAGIAGGLSPFAALGGSLYAAGYFGATASVGFTTGADWQGIDTSTLGTASSLVAHSGAIYGAFAAPDGSGAVGRLSGTTWQRLGGAFTTVPGSLASVNGDLYAVGALAGIDGAPYNGIARWDGAAWQPLGTGAVGSVLALAGLNGNVVAGGDFASVGSKGYSRFAVYGCVPTPPCAADFNHSGATTVQDIFDFLSAWFAGSPSADFNGVAGITVQDIFDFLAAWFAGCP